MDNRHPDEASDISGIENEIKPRRTILPVKLHYWFWHSLRWIMLLTLTVCDRINPWFDFLMKPLINLIGKVFTFCDSREAVWDLELAKLSLASRQRRHGLGLLQSSEQASRCHFLTRLPPELRLEIYRYVIDYKHVHLATMERNQRLFGRDGAHRVQASTCTNGYCQKLLTLGYVSSRVIFPLFVHPFMCCEICLRSR